MAARRLLIVMLILLGLSTLAAALIPPRETSEDGTTATTEETASVPTETQPAGEQVSVAVPIRKRRVSVVPVDAGDQLALAICSKNPDQVEIPAFGLLEVVGPAEPATFQLLVEEPGTYGVRLVSADRVAVRIQVAKPAPADSESGSQRKLKGPQRKCAELAGLPTGS
jgi:hypothetical protein